MSSFSSEHLASPVKQVRDGIWAFPPKDPSGVVAWWLECLPVPVLIDCPEVSAGTIESLKRLCGERSPTIFLTNRESH